MIQQATLQVLQPEWDPTFSEESFGFRPGRSAHQAVARAREHYLAGAHCVVDLDLEKFLDTSSYYTPSDVLEPKSPGWLSITLMRRPLRFP